jgi:tetratricopeptide (TPR) repeat protein
MRFWGSPVAGRTEDRGSDLGYLLGFAATALLLVVATLALVLVVLPQRYVLSSGFRESGLAFPEARTPFVPSTAVQIPARTLTATATSEIVPRGPAEIFWDRVTPLLKERRFADALPLFERYLDQYPADLDARREHAVTLVAAGRAARAVSILSDLLERRDDPAIRLLLARTLRDLGRTEEASEHYQRLSVADPADVGLWVEWGRALSAASSYSAAERVLRRALDRHPESVPVRVELARIYYYTNRLAEAEQMLATLPDRALAELGAESLRNDVLVALATPEAPVAEPAPSPTLLERAVAAREEDDLANAARLFEEALAADSASVEAWLAYADFLQYEQSDLEGARRALLEVERLTDGAPDLQLRLAQLEIWTGRLPEAEERLLAWLDVLDQTPDGALAEREAADARALLGDLYRWEGRRLAAVEQYEGALALEPGHAAARDGLTLVQQDVVQDLVEIERPRIGALASSISDTDRFDRFDAGAEWSDMSNAWVWGAHAGTRWVSGFNLLGAPDTERGAFLETEVGRWWRWGTLRTAFRFGVEDLRSDGMDVLGGASLRFTDQAGGRTDLSVDREAAHLRTNTLQSVRAGLIEHRLTAGHARPLSGRWSVAASGDVASLDDALPGEHDAGLRLQGSLSVGRGVGPLTLGVTTGVARFTEAAPSPGGIRLYWDPNSVVSVGLYALMRQAFDDHWTLSARLGSGVARLDERGVTGTEIVPHLSAEAGVAREGERYRLALDLFCFQGRFDGYRAYGMNLSLSARAGFRREEPR